MSYHYNLKMITSGNRLEVYKYSLSQEVGRPSNNHVGRKGKGAESKKDKNRRETLNRARNSIIRLVNCNRDLTTFVTLTYAAEMKDISRSKAHIQKFTRDIRKDYEGFKYLYVLEFQNKTRDNVIHYHMICNLPISIKTAKSRECKPQVQKDMENEFRARYWPYGFVDIRNLQDEGNTNIGLYVSVYLVEDLFSLDLGGNKCYGYSRNLLRPREETMLIDSNNIDIIKDLSKYYDISYMSTYNMVVDYGDVIKYGNVNYFDMWERDRYVD